MYHQTSQSTGIRKVSHLKSLYVSLNKPIYRHSKSQPLKSLYVSSNKPIYRHSKSQPFEKSVCIIKQANLQAFEKSTIEKVCMYHQTSQATGIWKVNHWKSLYVSSNKPRCRHSKSPPLKKTMYHQTSHTTCFKKVNHWKNLYESLNKPSYMLLKSQASKNSVCIIKQVKRQTF